MNEGYSFKASKMLQNQHKSIIKAVQICALYKSSEVIALCGIFLFVIHW